MEIGNLDISDKVSFLLARALRQDNSDSFVDIYDKLLPPLDPYKIEIIKERARILAEHSDEDFQLLSSLFVESLQRKDVENVIPADSDISKQHVLEAMNSDETIDCHTKINFGLRDIELTVFPTREKSNVLESPYGYPPRIEDVFQSATSLLDANCEKTMLDRNLTKKGYNLNSGPPPLDESAEGLGYRYEFPAPSVRNSDEDDIADSNGPLSNLDIQPKKKKKKKKKKRKKETEVGENGDTKPLLEHKTSATPAVNSYGSLSNNDALPSTERLLRTSDELFRRNYVECIQGLEVSRDFDQNKYNLQSPRFSEQEQVDIQNEFLSKPLRKLPEAVAASLQGNTSVGVTTFDDFQEPSEPKRDVAETVVVSELVKDTGEELPVVKETGEKLPVEPNTEATSKKKRRKNKKGKVEEVPDWIEESISKKSKKKFKKKSVPVVKPEDKEDEEPSIDADETYDTAEEGPLDEVRGSEVSENKEFEQEYIQKLIDLEEGGDEFKFNIEESPWQKVSVGGRKDRKRPTQVDRKVPAWKSRPLRPGCFEGKGVLHLYEGKNSTKAGKEVLDNAGDCKSFSKSLKEAPAVVDKGVVSPRDFVKAIVGEVPSIETGSHPIPRVSSAPTFASMVKCNVKVAPSVNRPIDVVDAPASKNVAMDSCVYDLDPGVSKVDLERGDVGANNAGYVDAVIDTDAMTGLGKVDVVVTSQSDVVVGRGKADAVETVKAGDIDDVGKVDVVISNDCVIDSHIEKADFVKSKPKTAVPIDDAALSKAKAAVTNLDGVDKQLNLRQDGGPFTRRFPLQMVVNRNSVNTGKYGRRTRGDKFFLNGGRSSHAITQANYNNQATPTFPGAFRPRGGLRHYPRAPAAYPRSPAAYPPFSNSDYGHYNGRVAPGNKSSLVFEPSMQKQRSRYYDCLSRYGKSNGVADGKFMDNSMDVAALLDVPEANNVVRADGNVGDRAVSKDDVDSGIFEKETTEPSNGADADSNTDHSPESLQSHDGHVKSATAAHCTPATSRKLRSLSRTAVSIIDVPATTAIVVDVAAVEASAEHVMADTSSADNELSHDQHHMECITLLDSLWKQYSG